MRTTSALRLSAPQIVRFLYYKDTHKKDPQFTETASRSTSQRVGPLLLILGLRGGGQIRIPSSGSCSRFLYLDDAKGTIPGVVLGGCMGRSIGAVGGYTVDLLSQLDLEVVFHCNMGKVSCSLSKFLSNSHPGAEIVANGLCFCCSALETAPRN